MIPYIVSRLILTNIGLLLVKLQPRPIGAFNWLNTGWQSGEDLALLDDPSATPILGGQHVVGVFPGIGGWRFDNDPKPLDEINLESGVDLLGHRSLLLRFLDPNADLPTGKLAEVTNPHRWAAAVNLVRLQGLALARKSVTHLLERFRLRRCGVNNAVVLVCTVSP